MATPSCWSCPICHDTRDGLALILPCLHEFCFGCAMRWARQKPVCPLCTGPIRSIKFSVWEEDDFLAYSIMPPTPQSVPGGSAEGAPRHPGAGNPPGPRASPPPAPQPMLLPAEHGAAGTVPRGALGGLQADTWAALIEQDRAILEPVLPWLRGELQEIHGAEWWKAVAAESLVLSTLCLYGLDEEALFEMLQPDLQHHTQNFVRQLTEVIVRCCSEEAHRLLSQQNSRTVRGPWGSPMNRPGTSSSSSGAQLDELPSTSDAALRGGPRCPFSATIPVEREEPHEEPGQEVAGPSGQACSHSPSADGQGRDRSPTGSRRPPKRRASSPQESPPPCKRPPQER
ncbi:TOPRS ligase, partial [Anseranas semipalmata]|nr:TOPRS ligase [Anseranas semipalmata]